MKYSRTPVFVSDEPVIPSLPHPPSVEKFRELVLSYYNDHGRDLAWRRTTDPYHILVSEIMLQQTQVERVIRKYPAFIDAFPDFPSLAGASLSDVLAVWQGMGYNRRAISLQGCARRVVEEYSGMLPLDPEILAAFPGIGRATAASICVFTSDMPLVFIETNIRRVFIHFFFQDRNSVPDADILTLVKKTLPEKNPRIWYWALMDLGSALKKIPNPNRRSARYVRQSPFEGSDRELRGKIIKLLLNSPGLTITELVKIIGEESGRVQRIVVILEKEGFLSSTCDGITIRSR